MPSCDDVLERLSPHLDGHLASEEAAGVDAHLSDCSRCGATWSDLQAAMALAAEAPRLELDPALIDRTIAAAGARPQATSPAPFLAALAIAAAVALAFLLLLDWAPPSPQPRKPSFAQVPRPPAPRVEAEAAARARARAEQRIAAEAIQVAELELARRRDESREQALILRAYASAVRSRGLIAPDLRLRSAQAATKLGDPTLAALSYLNLVEVPQYRAVALKGLRRALADLGTASVDGTPTQKLSAAALYEAVRDDATIEVVKGRSALLLLRRSSAGDLAALKELGEVRVSGRAVAVKADEKKLRRLLKKSAPMRRMLERRARAR